MSYGLRVLDTNGYIQLDSRQTNWTGATVDRYKEGYGLSPEHYDPRYNGDILFIKWNPYLFGYNGDTSAFISLERDYATGESRFVRSYSYQSEWNWDAEYVSVEHLIMRPSAYREEKDSSYGLYIPGESYQYPICFDSNYYDSNIRVDIVNLFALESLSGRATSWWESWIADTDTWIMANFLDWNRYLDDITSFGEVAVGILFCQNDPYYGDGAYYMAYRKVDLDSGANPNYDYLSWGHIPNQSHIMTANITSP